MILTDFRPNSCCRRATLGEIQQNADIALDANTEKRIALCLCLSIG
jgi:hypothetical protein